MKAPKLEARRQYVILADEMYPDENCLACSDHLQSAAIVRACEHFESLLDVARLARQWIATGDDNDYSVFPKLSAVLDDIDKDSL